MVRQADHIFIQIIREWGLYDRISQAYAALDTSKAVGVMVGSPFEQSALCHLASCSKAKFTEHTREISELMSISSSCERLKLPIVRCLRENSSSYQREETASNTNYNLVMTARAFPFDHDFLAQVSTRIVNMVKVSIVLLSVAITSSSRSTCS